VKFPALIGRDEFQARNVLGGKTRLFSIVANGFHPPSRKVHLQSEGWPSIRPTWAALIPNLEIGCATTRARFRDSSGPSEITSCGSLKYPAASGELPNSRMNSSPKRMGASSKIDPLAFDWVRSPDILVCRCRRERLQHANI